MIKFMEISPHMSASSDDSELTHLVDQAAANDDRAWAALVDRHRDRLKRMVAARMDRRLLGRVDPSDIIQEACLVAARKLSTYAAHPEMPFYLWLRWIVGQKLIDEQRRHLGAQIRRVGREADPYHGAFPETTSKHLAAEFVGQLGTPSEEAIRIEHSLALQVALDELEPIDREILALRHFEQLTNGEAATVLNIDKSAASKRYTRALRRLRDALVPLLGSDF
jgi:RNA polymerase sigma-70 factor (ECF subfamily)